jgi:predicted Zn-dependent protease
MDRFPIGRPRQAANPHLIWVCGLFLGVALGISHPPSMASEPPPPQAHPMPPTLAQWQPTVNGDYFDQIPKLSLGYLVWSKFPVTVYLDLADPDKTREPVWIKVVEQAITDWHRYLPLERADRAETANIIVRRAKLPLRLGPDRKILPMRMAETGYVVNYGAQGKDRTLGHKVTITLSPNQADAALLSAARHELGHGLGIWGHSPDPTDIMYFSQVRTPPEISPRDINTLKRIYAQPTQLGW